jgi:hypothetical protein
VPVHRVAGRGSRQLGEHSGADAAAGEHQRRAARGGLDIHQLGDQPRRDRLGQQPAIVMNKYLRWAHAVEPYPC